MNSFIETLNHSGGTFLDFAWPIAWQSGLLIAALLAFDFLFRRQIRASVRYAVWLVVLVKLILPPTLALPTSPAWWLLHQPPVIQIKPQMQNYTVSYDDESLSPVSLNSLPAYVPPKPAMTWAAWLLVLSTATSTGLLAWLLIRWWQITRRVSRAKTSERLAAIAAQTRLLAGIRARPPVKLTADTMSPAVCGLFRPAILIPQTLTENFSDEQLRAVLLHELIHLRRRDVWVNFLQSLLQIVYWWHPLVWLANARIRRVREEAVDDAVMLALAGGAEAYAPTLLQVAKLALNRPLVSLGLVGIMESRSALRQRIERLVDFRPPRRAGLTLVSIFGILAFTAVAVPMGGAPGVTEEQALPTTTVPVPAVTALDTNRPPILIEAQIYQLRAVDFEKAVSGLKFNQAGQSDNSWWSASPEKFNQLSEDLRASRLKPVSRPRVLTRSGWPAELYTGNDTNSLEFDCLPLMTNGLIELAAHGFAVAKSANVSITNQFSVKTVMEDHGGMVVRMNNADGSIESNVFMVTIGVQMVTDTARYQQRLETIIQKKQPSVNDMVESAKNVDENPLSMSAENMSETGQWVPQARLDQVGPFVGVSLGEVLHELSEATKRADLAGHGMRFVAGSFMDDQPADLNNVFINIPSALKDVSLDDALEAIKQGANKPIKYSLVEDEIVFSAVDKERLLMRTYWVNLNAFLAGLQQQSGIKLKGNMSLALRNYFTKLGVDMESPPGKSVFYNDRLGRLFVKATEPDLDIIEHFIIEHFIQLRIQTAPTSQSGLQFSGPQEFPPSSGTVTGIVSNPNFSAALHELQKRNAVKESPEPEVVTRSGREVNRLDEISIPLASENSAESSSQNTPAAHLFLRGFKVDTQTFLASLGLKPLPGDFGENSPPAFYPALRKFVTDLGINLESPSGKTISFNEKRDLLYVKATESDLDKIGRVLQALPPQLHIKARFLEVPKGTFAGLANVVNIPNQSNQLVGILANGNFQAALRNLQARPDVEELAEPEVVMLSGRQAQIRATQIITVVTNVSFPHEGPSGITAQTTQVETGPVLDVVPYVLSDGYTINLTTYPTMTKFLGYTQKTNMPVADSQSIGQRSGSPIFPNFQILESKARLNLWDDQTVVMEIKEPSHVYSDVPILGDIPLIGNLFQSQRKIEPEKELIVFVTVTIIDPAGNRVHSDDDLPFAKTGIPPQPPQ